MGDYMPGAADIYNSMHKRYIELKVTLSSLGTAWQKLIESKNNSDNEIAAEI